jgi:hypothetical protein
MADSTFTGVGGQTRLIAASASCSAGKELGCHPYRINIEAMPEMATRRTHLWERSTIAATIRMTSYRPPAGRLVWIRS